MPKRVTNRPVGCVTNRASNKIKFLIGHVTATSQKQPKSYDTNI